MSNNSIGSKLSLGLNHLTKKVAAQPVEAKEVGKAAAKAGKVAGDALVRSAGAVGQAGQAVGDLVQAAEVRLAKAFHKDPKQFALNLAKATLDDIASKI